MTRQNQRPLLDRLVSVHRPDCSVLARTEAASSMIAADDAAVASRLAEGAQAYAIEARGIFESLRRLIGQLAGLLILTRLTDRADILDLPEVEQCRRRWRESAERLAGLEAVGPLTVHRCQLLESNELCGAILTALSHWRTGDDREAAFLRMNMQIKRAYALLENCSSERLGLQVVDLSHACCSCGHAQQT